MMIWWYTSVRRKMPGLALSTPSGRMYLTLRSTAQ